MQLIAVSLALSLAAAALSPPQASPAQTADAGARGPIQLNAQAPPNGESALVEELEVVAQAPGPALWRVTRGESQVVIIGAYTPLPHSLDWNKVRLMRALDGASGFYEAKVSINPVELATLFFDQGAFRLGGGRKLDDVIGSERQARLRRVAAISHADVGRMQPYKPAVAGIFAYQTFLRTVGLSAEKPGTTIRRLADAQHVPKRALAKLGAMSVIRAMQRMDATAQLACFDATLDQTEWESAHAIEAAHAWADGHVTQLRRLHSTAILDHCLGGGGAKAVLDKGVADSVTSIEDLLAKPGRTVALIDMDFLTLRNGVLDRLKAKGAEISVPPP